MSETNNNDPLLTRNELCERGRFGKKTLQRLEAKGEGPPAIQITPALTVYRQSGFDQWLAARTRTGIRPAGKAPTLAIEARHKRRGVR
jgi:predicted DNA-binding transcriptional regulator AlpA